MLHHPIPKQSCVLSAGVAGRGTGERAHSGEGLRRGLTPSPPHTVTMETPPRPQRRSERELGAASPAVPPRPTCRSRAAKAGGEEEKDGEERGHNGEQHRVHPQRRHGPPRRNHCARGRGGGRRRRGAALGTFRPAPRGL